VVHNAGYQPCQPRRAGQARPALTNLALLAELLHDASAVERVASPPQIHAYRVTRARGTAYVVWTEDALLQLPGEAEPTVAYSLTVDGAATARVRLSALDTTDVVTSNVDAANGVVALTLSSRPVIVDSFG